MPSIKQVHFPIVNGPSKWDLSVALFDRKVGDPRLVDFTMKFNDREVLQKVVVNSVRARDGSGESWTIEGYATVIAGEGDLRGTVPRAPRRTTINFRTDKRSGTIAFLG